jgi:hypothetical protein
MFVDARNKKAYAVCKCGLEWESPTPQSSKALITTQVPDAWKKQSYGIIKQPPKKDAAKSS